MSKPNQLFLLADHIKLSLLERQRATSLGLDRDAHDGQLSRALDQFRSGLAALEQAPPGDASAPPPPAHDDDDDDAAAALPALRKQLDDLTAQFHGFSSPATQATLHQANSPELAHDFAHAASRKPKTVRFSDTPPSPSGRLFAPYRDQPATAAAAAADDDRAGYRDQADDLSNQQLHQHHAQILDEQDEQLDRLGESIGRQRELSMQIGDELDGHVAMLDQVDAAADRHQSRLDRARKTLAKVARGAGENRQMTAIVVLIIILVLLIAVLK